MLVFVIACLLWVYAQTIEKKRDIDRINGLILMLEGRKAESCHDSISLFFLIFVRLLIYISTGRGGDMVQRTTHRPGNTQLA